MQLLNFFDRALIRMWFVRRLIMLRMAIIIVQNDTDFKTITSVFMFLVFQRPRWLFRTKLGHKK